MIAKYHLGFYNKDMYGEGENQTSRISKFAPPRLITEADLADVVVDSTAPPSDAVTEQHVEESIAAKKTYELQQKINASRGGPTTRYAEVQDQGSIGHTARLQMEVEAKRQSS